MSNTSTGGSATDSLNGRLTFEQDKNRIVGKDADNLIRMLILANGIDFNMKISDEGIDVLNATPDQIIFDTNNKLFKIIDEGIITAPPVTTVADGTNTNSGAATNSVGHGFTFTPLIIAFLEVSPNQYTLMPYSETVSANAPSGGVISKTFRITTSATSVNVFHYVVSYSPGIGAGTYSGADIKYYLLQQTAV